METCAKSIRDFGAVGDGKADDTNAFAKAVSGGKTKITIPFGLYRITSTIYIESDTELVFCDGARIISDTADGPCFSNTRGAHSIQLYDAFFDGTSSKGDILCFKEAFDVVVCGISFVNCPLCAIRLEDTEGFMISGIRFSYFGDFAGCCGIKIASGCEKGIISDIVVLNQTSLFGTLLKLCAGKNPDQVVRDIAVTQLYAMNCEGFADISSDGADISGIRAEIISGGTRKAISLIGKNGALFSDIAISHLELFSEDCKTPLVKVKANVDKLCFADINRPGIIDNKTDGLSPTLLFCATDLTAYRVENVNYNTIQKIDDASSLASRGINPKGYDNADYEGAAKYGDRLVIPDGGCQKIILYSMEK